MNINSVIREISSDNETCDKIEGSLSEFYVFGINSSVNHKPVVPFNVKSNTLYKICFSLGEAKSISSCSTLSFTYLAQKPIISENVRGYETYFTKDLINKEILTLSEKLGLFKPELPMMFLVNQNQEWRINEIFKSMIDESAGTYADNTEMIRTLIHELILFSQRLLTVDTNSV